VNTKQGNELIEWAAETGFDGTHALDKSLIESLRAEIESLRGAPVVAPEGTQYGSKSGGEPCLSGEDEIATWRREQREKHDG
jgi:hypothetical protein